MQTYWDTSYVCRVHIDDMSISPQKKTKHWTCQSTITVCGINIITAFPFAAGHQRSATWIKVFFGFPSAEPSMDLGRIYGALLQLTEMQHGRGYKNMDDLIIAKYDFLCFWKKHI